MVILVLNNPLLLALGCSAAMLCAVMERLTTASRPGLPSIEFLGNAFYSFHLAHSFVLSPIFCAAFLLGLRSKPLLLTAAVAATTACVVVGVAVHVPIERPLLRTVR